MEQRTSIITTCNNKLICIEVYLHSASTHSSARKKKHLPVWSLHVVHLSAHPGFVGPAVLQNTHTANKQPGRVCLSAYVKSTAVPTLEMWNLWCYINRFHQQHADPQPALRQTEAGGLQEENEDAYTAQKTSVLKLPTYSHWIAICIYPQTVQPVWLIREKESMTIVKF